MPSTHTTSTVITLSLAVSLLAPACSATSADPGPDGGISTDSSVPTPTDASADAGAEPPGEPIVAPADVWTWVDFPASRCLKGSPTGLGVRIRPGSRRLVLYMMGGGGCSTAACWGPDPGAQNLDGYGKAEFDGEGLKTNLAVFDTSPGTTNPFADANMVMVPYCTGDAHTGTRAVDLDVGGEKKTTYFYGARNMETFLRRLAPTFPGVDRIFLVGTSAGGAGAKYNYARVKASFGKRVDSIVDSAPGIDTASDIAKAREKATLYGATVPGCPTCQVEADVHSYNRSLDPKSRYAFLSFRYDNVTKNDLTLAEFSTALQDYVKRLDEDPEAGALVVDNPISSPLHVVLTRPALTQVRSEIFGFLRDVADGASFPPSKLVPLN
ncbi:MAG: pectin acetylesterase-family hydrolase [Polyangiaceae bacterium]